MTLWHKTGATLLRTLSCDGVLKALAWRPDGSMLASAASTPAADRLAGGRFKRQNNRRRLCGGRSSTRSRRIVGIWPTRRTFHPRAACDWADKVIGFDAATGKRLWEISNPAEQHFFALAFSPEGDVFRLWRLDFRATMYRLEDKKKLASEYIGPETEDHVGGRPCDPSNSLPDGKTVSSARRPVRAPGARRGDALRLRRRSRECEVGDPRGRYRTFCNV